MPTPSSWLAHFEAEVTFLPQPPGLHQKLAGWWRPDMRYAEELPGDGTFMINPIEWIVDGRTLEEGEAIPQVSIARFHILMPSARKMHQQRIRIGTKLRIVEVTYPFADATVTRILHLHDPSNVKTY